jgi:hypothetical protein
MCSSDGGDTWDRGDLRRDVRLGRGSHRGDGSAGRGRPRDNPALDEFGNKMRVDHFGTFLALRFAIPEMIKCGADR